MKKQLLLLLAITLSLSLTACDFGKDNKASILDSEDEKPTSEETSDTTTTEENKDTNEVAGSKAITAEEEAKAVAEFEKSLETDKENAEKAGKTVIHITSPKRADKFETGLTELYLWGEITNPANVVKVKINDYTLNKYVPGTKTFNYIASINYGTMKRGENIYKVKALDAKGNIIAETEYTIVSSVVYSQLSQTGWESTLFAFVLSIFAYIAIRRGYVRVRF